MGDITKIEWCHHTFNPWVGCSKVHAGCANCYAEADMDKRRHFATWGLHGTRVRTSPANWKLPIKWNNDAEAAGERRRVFCASLADVFEDWTGNVLDSRKISDDFSNGVQFNPVLWHRDDIGVCTAGQTTVNKCRGERLATMNDLRRKLFRLIDATPWLDWMLLTKRPERILDMWSKVDDYEYVAELCELNEFPMYRRENVWLGTSVSNQETADSMIPSLLTCRDLCPVLFLSAEPLVGHIEFSDVTNRADRVSQLGKKTLTEIDLVIVGGESGHNARPCATDWIRSITEQCRDAEVACFVKQLGRDPNWNTGEIEFGWHQTLNDLKGGNPIEWPTDLRVRQMPFATTA